MSEQDHPAPVPSEEEVAAELDQADAEVPDEGTEAVDGDAAPPDEVDPVLEPGPRRYPSTIGGAFYLLVLGATAVGVGIVATGDWRLGIRCVAGALCFAAVVRLVMPERDAGMLAVRSRYVDCLVLGGVGAALFFLASTIPNQPV